MLLVVVLSCDLPFIPLQHVCRQSTGSAVCFGIAGWADEMANILPPSMLFCWRQCHLSTFCRSKWTHQIQSCGQRSWRWWQTRSVWCWLFGQAEWYMTEEAWLASWIKIGHHFAFQTELYHSLSSCRKNLPGFSLSWGWHCIKCCTNYRCSLLPQYSLKAKPRLHASVEKPIGISWGFEIWCWQAPNFCWLTPTTR